MKKIYFMMTAAMFAASVSAQKLDLQYQPTCQIAQLPAQCRTEAYAKAHQAGVRLSGIGLDISNPALSLPLRLAAESTSADTIVTAQPEGELIKGCYQQASGYYIFWGYVLSADTDGGVVDLVKGADGSIYAKNLMSMLHANTWVKGYKAEGDTIAFDFPQKVYTEDYYGTVYNYSLWRMKYTIAEEDGEEYATYVPDTESQTIKFTLRNDTLQMVEEDDCIMGLGTTEDGEWTGYGDFANKVFRVTDPVYAPASAASAEQALVKFESSGETDYRIAKMAIEGDDVYLGNLVDGNDTGWAKGKIEGNKVKFSGPQYLGINESLLSHEYFSPAGKKEVYEADWDYTWDSVYVEKELVFDYDAATKTLTSDGGFIVNKGSGEVNQEAEFFSPVINPYKEVAGTPQKPLFADFLEYSEDYGYGGAQFSIYRTSADGNYLNPEKLYYNVYFDDELFTFTPDEYPEFEEDVTDVPYSYSGTDVTAYGDSHILYFYIVGFDKMGVSTVYKDGDTRYESPIEWYYLTTDGIEKVADNSMASTRSVTYTDIMGRRLASPARGVNIKTTTMSDGTVRTQKVIMR